jgi:hypothetical protein
MQTVLQHHTALTLCFPLGKYDLSRLIIHSRLLRYPLRRYRQKIGRLAHPTTGTLLRYRPAPDIAVSGF